MPEQRSRFSHIYIYIPLRILLLGLYNVHVCVRITRTDIYVNRDRRHQNSSGCIRYVYVKRVLFYRKTSIHLSWPSEKKKSRLLARARRVKKRVYPGMPPACWAAVKVSIYARENNSYWLPIFYTKEFFFLLFKLTIRFN